MLLNYGGRILDPPRGAKMSRYLAELRPFASTAYDIVGPIARLSSFALMAAIQRISIKD
jgi:hypothetical protein